MINPKIFSANSKKNIQLSKWATQIKPLYKSKEHYEQLLQEHIGQLSELQNRLYAHNRYSLLLIFQAMDAAGKDSVIKHVMSGVNPQGCQVFSFKHPSVQDLEHDFLWRTTQCLPERGRIGIFNRSYYEEVLIVKVHPEILLAQGLPDEEIAKKSLWENRYKSIVDLEEHLHRNGTQVIKFFLHVSEEEQRRRFLKRIDNPEKNWKFSQSDIEERKLWKPYMRAYEECLSATSKAHSPWYIVPADDKKNTRLIVSRIILDTLNKLDLSYPKTDAKHQKELLVIKKLLLNEV
jgi:PPK2 family polyphosphate:nucleotide phosphotransferase